MGVCEEHNHYTPDLCCATMQLGNTNIEGFLVKFQEALQHGNHLSIQYGDVIMGLIASQITSLTIVYSSVYSNADQRKHPSSASLAFVRGIHQGPVNSPHKWPVTRKMFPFDDVIMLKSTPVKSPRWYALSLYVNQHMSQDAKVCVGVGPLWAICCSVRCLL